MMAVPFRHLRLFLVLGPTVSALTFRHFPNRSFGGYKNAKSLAILFAWAQDESVALSPQQVPPMLSSNIEVVIMDESLSRQDGSLAVTRLLLPDQEYQKRCILARDAQGIKAGSVVCADDPTLSMSYGEFPLHSLDELLDLALTYHPDQVSPLQPLDTNNYRQKFQMVDLGSGCGRLVFYLALTRGRNTSIDVEPDGQQWDVHGIEIAKELHQEALRSVDHGIHEGLFQHSVLSPGATVPTFLSKSSHETQTTKSNTIHLHHGPVEEFHDVLHQANILFAYSSVFLTSGFSEDLCAMVLDPSWSQLLAESCQPGCLVITTDRVLDPKFGWKLLDQKSVDNKEICGSIGYIQVLT